MSRPDILLVLDEDLGGEGDGLESLGEDTGVDTDEATECGAVMGEGRAALATELAGDVASGAALYTKKTENESVRIPDH